MEGFSLIELLVAITVFALVALGISSSTLAASRANRVSEARTAAVIVAQDLLECLRLERIVGDTLNGTCSTTVPSGYTASVATSNVAPGVQLAVTVTWTAIPGGSVTLTTHAL